MIVELDEKIYNLNEQQMNMSLCGSVLQNWTRGLHVNLKRENGPPILFYFITYALKFQKYLAYGIFKINILIYYTSNKCINLK